MPGELQEIQIVVKYLNHKNKDGREYTSQSGPFIRICSDDRDYYSVFDKNLWPLLEDAKASQMPIQVVVETSGEWKTIVGVEGAGSPKDGGDLLPQDEPEPKPQPKPSAAKPAGPTESREGPQPALYSVCKAIPDLNSDALASAVRLLETKVIKPENFHHTLCDCVDFILKNEVFMIVDGNTKKVES